MRRRAIIFNLLLIGLILLSGCDRVGEWHDFYFTQSGGRTSAGGAPRIYVGGVVQKQSNRPVYAICLICNTVVTANSEGLVITLHYDSAHGIITAIEGHPIHPSLWHKAIYALHPDFSLAELPLSEEEVQLILDSLDHPGQNGFPTPTFTAAFTAKVYPRLQAISPKLNQP